MQDNYHSSLLQYKSLRHKTDEWKIKKKKTLIFSRCCVNRKTYLLKMKVLIALFLPITFKKLIRYLQIII